ncbi:MAG: PQQ-dependent sugar dehydrogenase [Puniceicoccaceae bacterium]|nr:MAG: PQQ-dependent sugar dehydrogenase [Puniceicoccaceae bacterium]
MKNAHSRYRKLSGLILGSVLLGGASAAAGPQVVNETVAESIGSEAHDFRLIRVATGFEHPWAVTWLDDGRMIVGERAGRMNLVDGDLVTPLSGLPRIAADEDQRIPPEGGGQGGLLDIVAHPRQAENGWIYFTYSSPGDSDSVVSDDRFGTGTALARARLNGDADGLTDLEILYVQQPLSAPGRHYGSRIVFPGDGSVIFSIGDNGLRYTSQDLTHPSGSMIRLLEDGGAHPGNPFVGSAPGNLRPEIYSFGHRNNQGLAIDHETGAIWATDHGPSGGDLLYRVYQGANYGWPQVSFGKEYSTRAPIGIGREAPGVTLPNHIWESSKAPSGLAVYRGDAFPDWQGNLFAGFLLAERVHRIVLSGNEVVKEEPLLEGKIGRIRDVREGPDGFLYLLTDRAEGGLYRIEPIDG